MATEKRLIYADETTSKLARNAGHILHQENGEYSVGRARGIMDAVDLINKLPTVDAAPVVHGHWIHDDEYDICSNCNNPIIMNRCSPDKWCKNCGAKMDG